MTQRSENGASFFLDLSARAKLRDHRGLTGSDFSTGKSQTICARRAKRSAMEACVLNAKGKLNAHIFIAALGESLLIDAEPELRETLRARLERYVIADDVQIEDVTDEFSLFHVLTEQPPAPGVMAGLFRRAVLPRRVGTSGATQHATMLVRR